MTKVTLPAQDIEIPRMGEIVYVHPDLYMGKKKIGIQIAAVVIGPEGIKELQTFTYDCDTLGQAVDTQKEWQKRLAKGGPFLFVQTGVPKN